MPHQKNPVESLREEFREFCKSSGNLLVVDVEQGKEVGERRVADWWLDKFDTHHDQILMEMLEEVGENEVSHLPSAVSINYERQRIRSILLVKKRKV